MPKLIENKNKKVNKTPERRATKEINKKYAKKYKLRNLQIVIERVAPQIYIGLQQQQRNRNVVDRIPRKMSDNVNKPDKLKLEGNLSENWRRFKRNFNIYMSAAEYTEKSDAIKIAIFLNIIGGDAIEVFDTFNLSAQQRLDYNTVINSFEIFCKPKTNEVYERFVFYQRDQKEGEPFDTFLMDIRRLVRTCEFGQMEEAMLRDRIVMGVANKKLQTKLLEVTQLDYTAAVEKCRANEITNEQAMTMNKPITVHEINKNFNQPKNSNNNNSNNKSNGFQKAHGSNNSKNRYENNSNGNRNNNKRYFTNNNNQNSRFTDNTNKNNDNKNSNKCKFCNLSHKPKNCPAYGKICNSCHKRNHFSSVCKSKNVQPINAIDFSDNNSDFYVNSIKKYYDKNDRFVYSTSSDTISSWKENIQIKNKNVLFKIDTGSDVNIMPYELMNKYFSDCFVYNTSIILRAFGGFEIKPIGMCILRCIHNNKIKNIKFQIVDTTTIPILGLNACIDFELINMNKNKKSIENFSNNKQNFC